MGDAGWPGAAKVDFFISYTAADQDVAEWIAWVLEEAGYQTAIQVWDFRPGREFVTEMQQALERAERVLAVLSAGYLRSDFARQEWNAALASDPSGTAGRLVPVRVAEADLQGLDRPRIYIDLLGLPEEEAKARLLAGVKAGRAKPTEEPDYPARLGQPPAAPTATEPVAAAPSMLDREFRAHWDPRARGVSLAIDLGWYFAGRTQVLRQLVTWISDPDLDHRARVVTGDPGSGKSAVLARLVTLADPQVRQRVPPSVLAAAPAGTLPPPGGIDAAIHARNKTLPDVLAALATATGTVQPDVEATVTSPDQQVRSLVDQLIARPQRRVVILDALDEAIDPQQLAMQLLGPLLEAAAQSGLRMLVGTRRPLVEALGDRIVVLDLDAPDYLDEADLAEYVTRVLLAEHEPDRPTPYRGRRELAEQVAQEVAGRAQKTFLLARIVAQSLLSDDQPVDTSRPGWELQLPATVGLAFEGYLERFGANQQRARDLLAALAFAEGSGLPRGLWASVGSALLGADNYADADIGWIVHAAADYLLEVPQQGRPVYRLYHEALAEHLRYQYPGLEPRRRLTAALRGFVPTTTTGQPDWEAADPYLRTHLASHAAAAGQLDELLLDPGFLLAANPNWLLRALPAALHPDGQRAADVYRGTLYQLRGRTLPLAAARLQLAARQYGADALAEKIGKLGLDLPWSVPWAHYTRAHSHLTVGSHTGRVQAMAVTTIDDRSIAVTGGKSDGTVRVWDLAAGIQLHQLTGHTGAVSALAVTTLDDRPVAITGGGYDDATVRVWDLAAGAQLHQLTGHTGAVSALVVTTLDDRPIVLTGGGDRSVRVWDPAAGTQLHQLTGHTGAVSLLAVTILDDRPIAVTGSYDDGTVRVWDLASGTQLRLPIVDGVWSWMKRRRNRLRPSFTRPPIAVATLDGRPIVLTGGGDILGRDGTVRVWDLAAGTQLHQLTGHTGAVSLLAVTTLDDRPIAITGSSYGDATVRVWDLTTGAQLHQLTGHARTIQAMAVATLGDRPIAITGGGESDGTVRVWDLAAGIQLHQLTGHTGAVSAVAVTTLDGRPVAVTGGSDGTVRVWDLVRDATHAYSDADAASWTKWVGALAVTTLDGRPIAITGGGNSDGTVRVWDLTTGIQLHQLTGHTGAVSALAVTTPGGRPVAITGGSDGTMRVWDLTAGTQLHQHAGHTGAVSALAVTTLDDRPVAITGGGYGDATVRVWDLTAGTQLHQLTGHTGAVSLLAVTTLDDRPIAVTGGKSDGTVRVWDLAAGIQLHQLTGHTGAVSALAVTTLDDRPVAITGGGYDDATVRVWDLAAGAQLHQLTGHTGAVSALVVTTLDDRPIVLTGGGGDRSVRVWDPAAGTQLHQLTGHTGAVSLLAVTILDDRPIAVTGSYDDGTVRVWDLATGAQLHQLTGHTGAVSALAVTTLDDRPVAITGGGDGTVRVWDLVGGTRLLVVRLGASVQRLTLSPLNIVLIRTPMGLLALQLHR